MKNDFLLGGLNVRKVKKPVFFIVLACILGFAYLTFAGIHTQYGDISKSYIKGVKDIRWGIDIQGGVNTTFEPADGYDATSDELDAAKAVIEQRLVSKNITDSEVYADYKKNRVMVSFPWQAGEEDFDPEEAVAELGETAMLKFVKGTEQTGEQVLTGSDVEKAEAATIQNSKSGGYDYVVSLKLKDSGKTAFANATTELASSGGSISIWMDDDMISAPTVNEAITDGSCQISGNFTAQSAKALADKINAGSLPFKLVTKSTSIVSPTLGEGAKQAMVMAGIIAFIIIAIYMIVVYKLPGVVAAISLFGQAVGTIACISGFFGNIDSFTLTIPGIAGIILAIGMGVDANVITAERIKEELNNGKTLNGAIELGYKRAWSAVFDGNITVVFVAVILMGAFGPTDSVFGTLLKPLFNVFGASTAGTIYSLGYTLLVGIILNFVFGIFCSRLMLSSLSRFKCFKKRGLYGAAEIGEDGTIKIKERKTLKVVSKRKIFYSVSCGLIALFIVLSLTLKPNVAIEFKGGTILSYSYTGDVNTSDVEKVVSDTLKMKATVTKGEAAGSDKTTFEIKFASKDGISGENQNKLKNALEKKFSKNDIQVDEASDVSASNGRDFFFKCLVACAFAAVITIIYIGFRFKKIGGISAGVFSVVALLHDMCMVYGCFLLCRFDINSNFMAVLLTILGYSINATIIIYDRIRENERLYGNKVKLDELVDMSVTQTVGRSVNTTVTTVLAMATVCVVCLIRGVSSIMSFAFPLIIGMIAGVYSSNCIAPTLWVKWKDHQAKKSLKNSKNQNHGRR